VNSVFVYARLRIPHAGAPVHDDGARVFSPNGVTLCQPGVQPRDTRPPKNRSPNGAALSLETRASFRAES
jgi:hypothetical protein